jgi:hypothetical protein
VKMKAKHARQLRAIDLLLLSSAGLILAACDPVAESPIAAPTETVAATQPLVDATTSPPPPLGDASVFRRATFDCGIDISYPKHWTVLSREEDLNIRASAQARGIIPTPGRKTLLLLNSTPEPHAAQLRLTLSAVTEPSRQMLTSLASDREALGWLGDGIFEELQSYGAVVIESRRDLRVVLVGSLPSLHLSYDRHAVRGIGNWRVDQYNVPLSDQSLQITLSYNVAAQALYEPILKSSLASISISPAC